MVRKCEICGTSKKVQRHHVFPKVHFGQSVRLLLCEFHHRELEYSIQMDEGQRNGKRIKRDRQFYLDKMVEFLKLYEPTKMEQGTDKRKSKC